VRVRFPADLTISNAGPLKASLLALADRTENFQFDMQAVTEMDSSCVQLILAFEREARARGCSIEYSLSDQARKISTIYGLPWT
jgi:ABC-type transporter Mla MlaB component